MDELVWEQTRRLVEQPDLVMQEYTARVQKKQRQQTEFKALLAKKKRESKQLELEKERLLDLYQSGQIALAEIESRLKSLRSKIKKSQDECALLEKEAKEESHRLQLIEQFADFTQRMKANLTNLNFEERRQIVRLLVEEVIVNTQTEEITVRHILPLDQKFPLCKGSNRTALRSSLRSRTRHSSCHHPGLQVSPDRAQHSLVADLPGQPRHQNIVVNSVERPISLIPPSRTHHRKKSVALRSPIKRTLFSGVVFRSSLSLPPATLPAMSSSVTGKRLFCGYQSPRPTWLTLPLLHAPN
jgi:hypothetical protein